MKICRANVVRGLRRRRNCVVLVLLSWLGTIYLAIEQLSTYPNSDSRELPRMI